MNNGFWFLVLFCSFRFRGETLGSAYANGWLRG
jgi:hypothetical protein